MKISEPTICLSPQQSVVVILVLIRHHTLHHEDDILHKIFIKSEVFSVHEPDVVRNHPNYLIRVDTVSHKMEDSVSSSLASPDDAVVVIEMTDLSYTWREKSGQSTQDS